MHGEAAAAIIKRENVNVKAGIVKEGTLVTTDFLCDRVRVWVDSYGIVSIRGGRMWGLWWATARGIFFKKFFYPCY